jgi:predicted alpha/beta-hydrolase family hydrolase
LRTVEIDTGGGRRASTCTADRPAAALAMSHGAGGGVEAPDLVAARDAALSERVSVALVEQPYRVAGRRSPAPAKHLDEAWVAVIEHLGDGELKDLPLIVGGRSLGARVACRTVEEIGAVAVLCLAFPLSPARGSRRAGWTARRGEAADLVVQGESDRFGMPPPGRSREVAKVPGDHGLKADLEAVAAAIRGWLPSIVRESAPAS